ncbi:hypothetical protein ACFQV8_25380 [Pseudonocardia benzenivorans]
MASHSSGIRGACSGLVADTSTPEAACSASSIAAVTFAWLNASCEANRSALTRVAGSALLRAALRRGRETRIAASVSPRLT